MASVTSIDGSQIATLRRSCTANADLKRLAIWIASRKRLDSYIPKDVTSPGIPLSRLPSAMKAMAAIFAPQVEYKISRREGVASAMIIRVPPGLLIQACRIALEESKDAIPEAVQAVQEHGPVEISEQEAFDKISAEMDAEIAEQLQSQMAPVAVRVDITVPLEALRKAMRDLNIGEMVVRA